MIERKITVTPGDDRWGGWVICIEGRKTRKLWLAEHEVAYLANLLERIRTGGRQQEDHARLSPLEPGRPPE